MHINVRNYGVEERAFSLIELLVVVAIIGILAAVGVVAYQGYTASAAVGATKANHANLVKWLSAELTKCDLGQQPNWKTQGGGQVLIDCGMQTGQMISALVVHLGAESWRNPHDSSKPAVQEGGMPVTAGFTQVQTGPNATGEILIQTKFDKHQHTVATPSELTASVICTRCQ